MKIVLATGIYPPELGGPATYVRGLAEELAKRGEEVRVVAFGADRERANEHFDVRIVSRWGGPLLRWLRYARVLRRVGHDADVIECFSSVSAGMPLRMARLRSPKKILRLGGDFLWERWTDAGGEATLREFTETRLRGLRGLIARWLLRPFDYLVFSTAFQQDAYGNAYPALPRNGVIENAMPAGTPLKHAAHAPLRLLFLGRFVAFKNIANLLHAVAGIEDVTLTLAGDGPLGDRLRRLARDLGLRDRAIFVGARRGEEKQKLLRDHDLLVLPSLTELSPHTALEARAAGMPVLLTRETGLSEAFTRGMLLADLRTPQDIRDGIERVRTMYETLAAQAAEQAPSRSFTTVAEEHMALFRSLLP